MTSSTWPKSRATCYFGAKAADCYSLGAEIIDGNPRSRAVHAKPRQQLVHQEARIIVNSARGALDKPPTRLDSSTPKRPWERPRENCNSEYFKTEDQAMARLRCAVLQFEPVRASIEHATVCLPRRSSRDDCAKQSSRRFGSRCTGKLGTEIAHQLSEIPFAPRPDYRYSAS